MNEEELKALVAAASANPSDGSISPPANLYSAGSLGVPTAGLLLPQSGTAIRDPLSYMGVYMVVGDYFDFSHAGLDKDQVADYFRSRILSSSDRNELLTNLSSLGLAMQREGLLDSVAHNLASRLKEPSAGRLRNALKHGENGQGNRVVLSRQVLLAAIRNCIVAEDVGRHTEPMSLAPDETALVFCHASGHELYRSQIEDETNKTARLAGLPEGLAIDLICNFAFNGSNDVFAYLDRHLRLWRDFGSEASAVLGGRHPLDLAKEALGIDFDELLTLGWVLVAHCIVWEPSKPIRYAGSLGLPSYPDEKRSAFLEYVAATVDELRSAFSEFDSLSHWNFLPLQMKPVVIVEPSPEIGKQLIVTDFAFLLERITSGVFWAVADHMRSTGGKKAFEAWTSGWGYVVEAYAESKLKPFAPWVPVGKSYFTEDDLKTIYPDEGQGRADATLDLGTGVIVSEIVSGSLKVDTRVHQRRKALDEDLEKIVFKKLRQLDSTIRCIIDDPAPLLGTDTIGCPIYPLLIAGGGFPVLPTTQAIIAEYCKENGLLDHGQQNVRPAAVIELSELEMLDGLRLSKAITIPELLDEWQRSAARNISFKNWLLDHFGRDHDLYRTEETKTNIDETTEMFLNRIKPFVNPDELNESEETE